MSVHSSTTALPVNAIRRSRVEKPGSNVTQAQISMPNAVLAVSISMLSCSTAPTFGYRFGGFERLCGRAASVLPGLRLKPNKSSESGLF